MQHHIKYRVHSVIHSGVAVKCIFELRYSCTAISTYFDVNDFFFYIAITKTIIFSITTVIKVCFMLVCVNVCAFVYTPPLCVQICALLYK